jgi:hypothetical protein
MDGAADLIDPKGKHGERKTAAQATDELAAQV